MNKTRLLIALVLAVCWFQWFAPQAAMACPTCKDGLSGDGSAAAFAFSILFMMAMPFVIMTGWVITIIRLRAKATSESFLVSRNH